MNAEQALLRLGASTAEAVQGVLQMFAPDGVALGHRRGRPAGAVAVCRRDLPRDRAPTSPTSTA